MEIKAGKLKDIYNTIVHNYQDLDSQSKENGKLTVKILKFRLRKICGNHPKIRTRFKILKFRVRKICGNHPKIRTRWLYHSAMSPKGGDGMANRVDCDQTASPDLGLYCLHRPDCPKTADHYGKKKMSHNMTKPTK